MNAARIVYVYREMSEYIRIEIDLLRERHDVTVIECASRWPRPLFLLRRLAGSDVAFTWFASWHSFLPALLCRLLGKPFVVTVGGYDTARLPGIGYGHQRRGLRRFVSLSWMLADMLSRIPLLLAFYLVGIRKRGGAGRGRLRASRD